MLSAEAEGRPAKEKGLGQTKPKAGICGLRFIATQNLKPPGFEQKWFTQMAAFKMILPW